MLSPSEFGVDRVRLAEDGALRVRLRRLQRNGDAPGGVARVVWRGLALAPAAAQKGRPRRRERRFNFGHGQNLKLIFGSLIGPRRRLALTSSTPARSANCRVSGSPASGAVAS
jgi:hypothetical protein